MEWREKETSVSRKTLEKIVLCITDSLKGADSKGSDYLFQEHYNGPQITRKCFNDLKTL